MAKYRKRPLVIEATQWDGTDQQAKELNLVRLHGKLNRITRGWFIATLEGKLHISPKDWIITGVEGERYPCKPVIFEKTYESV